MSGFVMDRFFDEKNMRLYRKLRDPGIEETQRTMILKLLAKEESKFKEQLRCTGIVEGRPG
jgi:hypothetical protein